MSFYSAHRKEVTVEMTLLNWGPNESLGDAVKPGYALVDYEAIAVESQRSS